MKVVFKRVGAYIIDIILVSIISTILTSNIYINKDYKKHSDTYEEYMTFYNEYHDFLNDLEKDYSDKTISKDEYDNLVKKYPSYKKYIDKSLINNKISDKEYKDILDNLNSNYNDKGQDYSYKLVKLSIISGFINILCILLYFVVIQYYFNGQTLGKKIFKIQVKSNNGKKLTLLNYFVRCLILNEVFINLLSIICAICLSKSNYIVYNQVIYFVTYILEMTLLFMIVFDKNNRGLHDYISNTKVVDLNE